ncbi:MAG: radical SAM protein [Humidesulfovibrio sp.]|uniref:radical SAM protein n=1 Tax=Humidesulfovibrio sp. TaxID=2910988 RepID=UPI0027ECBE72|nr:radical SAM protein [Humidesulfovibrio sp.]MDQ7834819.1 radical SAM protein [Humidesulfovibrio sp.]
MGNLYTRLKVFHYQDKLDSLPREKDEIRPPVHIRIKPTNVCNHRCSYCAYRAPELQLGQDMDLRDKIPQAKMLQIVDDIIGMGVKAVTFSGGGEPLCYPHMVETLERLADSPVAFATLTNGALLSGPTAKIFAKHGVWVRVSMDGWDDESYTRFRGAPAGEYRRIMTNMEDFKALGGGCYLGVSLIIGQDNASHVYEQIGRLADVGVDSVKLSPCITANDAAANNEYHRPVFNLVKEQAARAKADFGARLEIYDTYHELDGKFAKDYTWCPYLQMLPVIGADQRVYSCQDKAYNLDSGVLGEIREQSFREFWMNGKDKFFTIDPSKHCNHHCVANAKNQLVLEYLSADPRHQAFV